MAGLNVGDKYIGMQKTTSWGTATKPTTNDEVKVISFTPPTGERNSYTNEMESANQNIATCLDMLEFLQQTLSFSVKARYDSPALIKSIATVYGQYSYDADTPVAGVNKHSFLWDSLIDSVDDLLHTVTYTEGDEYKAVPSALITGFSMENDNGYQFNVDAIGDRVSISGWTSVSLTSFSACLGDLMEHSGVTILMNDESGDALDSGDEVVVNSISISPSRSYVNPPQQSGTNYPGKPYEGDTPAEFQITMELRAKDTTNAAWFSKYQAGTKQKMSITITGDVITGVTPYTFYLEFPSLRFMDPITYNFEAPTPVTATLSIMKAQSNPTGMSNTLPNAYIYCTVTEQTGYPSI
jgi:hypothetical protein